MSKDFTKLALRRQSGVEKKMEKEVKKNISWKNVKQLYEKKYHCKIKTFDLSTPELVGEYIKKWELSSSSAEKLLSTPELVGEYIKKWELSSSSAEIIFSMHKEYDVDVWES